MSNSLTSYSVTDVTEEAPEVSAYKEWLEHTGLLCQIDDAARLAVPTFDPADATFGKVYTHLFLGLIYLRSKRLHLWRLWGLAQPLWLGSDGVIYRAFTEEGRSSPRCFGEGTPDPHHWKPARIERRKIAGLRRLLAVLNKHIEIYEENNE